jgi:hypothetical protein
MISRRKFLQTAAIATLALTSCAGVPGGLLRLPNRRKARYFVATESHYGGQQDLSGISIDRFLELPQGIRANLDSPYTLLTSVNDDGSGLRRIAIPFSYHCTAYCPTKHLVYLMGNYRPSLLLALDPETLELVAVENLPISDEKTFGGHGIPIPGTDLMAFTMNSGKLGGFDFISIRDGETLVERERFSTYGFDAHDITLSHCKTFFVCGHYGSLFGRGPYKGMNFYGYSKSTKPGFPGSAGGYVELKKVYPPSVTYVDLKSGKRIGLFADVTLNQSGHAVSDDLNQPYLPKSPSRIVNRKDLELNPRYTREGLVENQDNRDYQAGYGYFGINIKFDAKFREVIGLKRSSHSVNVMGVTSQESRFVHFAQQLNENSPSWLRTGPFYNGGLEFHPDGKHYIIATRDGFFAVERGTHKLNLDMSFPLALRSHAHMTIIT